MMAGRFLKMNPMLKTGRQSGITLIETLVTTVIFSVGLLGVAGLQVVSKRSNYEALQRTTAAHVTYGLFEDMRANPDSLAIYLARASIGGGVITAEPSPICDLVSAGCSPDQMAAHNLWDWEQALDGTAETNANGSGGGLNFPALCITGPAGGTAGVYTVTIAWRGTVELSDPGISACGANSGNYGANREYRRMMQVSSFIDPAL
jgi:type IV pilus assembly protein PilV